MEGPSDKKVTELRPPREERGEGFYVVGGPVQPRRGCYIQRTADQQLVEKLREGEYCHVFAPPQTGKSSLVARAARELRRQGFLTAVVDLSQTVGRDRESEAGRWYYGIAYRIVRDLRLGVDLQHWWQEKKPLSALQRITEFFWEVVLSNSRSPVVIMFDHVEAANGLDYATDLFHAVHASRDARASEPDYERLNFALFGTVLPEDPASKSRSSLLEIGRRIDLADFSFEDARPLCRELGLDSGNAERALYRVFYWTGGQPYLTQKLCRAMARSPGSVRSDDDVDEYVSSRFFLGNAPQNEPNLRRIRTLAEQGSVIAHSALRLYRRVRKGRRIRYDRHQPEHEWVRILGLAAVNADGLMRPRNRIYTEVFTSRWIRHVVPFNWRGVGRRAAILAVAVGLPYWYVQVLPKGEIKTLKRPAVEYSEAQEAYRDLRRLPGFGEKADRLFARVLERRSLAATTWGEALAADVELRALRGQSERADALLGQFWGRESETAAAQELRDRALIYRLRAAEMGAPEAYEEARALIGEDYPVLITGIRPKARIDGLGIDAAGRQVVTLTEGYVVQTWDAATGEPVGAPGGFPALAEEFAAVRRRVNVESPGTARSVSLQVRLRHPQATDVELRLSAPSGKTVVLPIRRQEREPDAPYLLDETSHPDLRAMRKEKIQGTWTLELEDQVTGTAGFLDGWTLTLDGSKPVIADDSPGNPILLPDPQPTSQVRVVLSPDGRRAAAVSSNRESRGFLQVWDTRTGTVTARIPVQAGPRIVAFDAEGQYLVTGRTEPPGHLSVWRAAAGQELLALQSERGFLTRPVLSATGSVLAVAEDSGDGNSSIRLVDLVIGKEWKPIPVTGLVRAMALGPEGRTVATLSANNVVEIWDSGKRILVTQLLHDERIGRMIFDPSGRWLATVERDEVVRVWSLIEASGSGRVLVSRETRDPLSVSFSGDGGLLVMRGRGRTFEVLSLPSGMPAGPPLRHSGEWDSEETGSYRGKPVSRAFDSTNSTVVTGRGGSMARVWQLGSARDAGDQAAVDTAVAQVFSLNPVNDQVAVGNLDGSVRFLDRGGPWSAPPEAQIGHAGPITALAYSPDGSRLASVGADGSVLLWDTLTSNVVGERFHHGGGRVQAVAVAPDNRRILTGGELGARLWDGVSGEAGPVLGPGRRVAAVAFSGDGKLAYTASADGLVQAWESTSGAPYWSGNMPGHVRALAISGDGRWVAAGMPGGQVYLWDSFKPIGGRKAVKINGWLLDMAFGADDTLYVQTGEWLHLISAGEEPTIRESFLLPGAVPPDAWRVSAGGPARVRMLAVDSGGHRIVQMELTGHRDASEGPDPGPESRWLDILKLRFDATGELVPKMGNPEPDPVTDGDDPGGDEGAPGSTG